MVEVCKGGICYICTESKWEADYKPKGFKKVEPVKAEPVSEEPVEVVAESPVVASTPKPRGRRK